jgi:hypothetical protein
VESEGQRSYVADPDSDFEEIPEFPSYPPVLTTADWKAKVRDLKWVHDGVGGPLAALEAEARKLDPKLLAVHDNSQAFAKKSATQGFDQAKAAGALSDELRSLRSFFDKLVTLRAALGKAIEGVPNWRKYDQVQRLWSAASEYTANVDRVLNEFKKLDDERTKRIAEMKRSKEAAEAEKKKAKEAAEAFEKNVVPHIAGFKRAFQDHHGTAVATHVQKPRFEEAKREIKKKQTVLGDIPGKIVKADDDEHALLEKSATECFQSIGTSLGGYKSSIEHLKNLARHADEKRKLVSDALSKVSVATLPAEHQKTVGEFHEIEKAYDAVKNEVSTIAAETEVIGKEIDALRASLKGAEEKRRAAFIRTSWQGTKKPLAENQITLPKLDLGPTFDGLHEALKKLEGADAAHQQALRTSAGDFLGKTLAVLGDYIKALGSETERLKKVKGSDKALGVVKTAEKWLGDRKGELSDLKKHLKL